MTGVVVVPAARSGRNFGCRPRAGVNDRRCPPGTNRQFHAGLDIEAPRGSPIYAPMPGEVLGNFPNGYYSRTGNALFIGTYDNTTLAFFHLAEQARNPATGQPWQPGDLVRAGEQIARVGATGACKGWPNAPQTRNARGVPCTNCGPDLCGGGSHAHGEVIPGWTARPNPRGPRIDPREYARLKGFAWHSGPGPGGLNGLGALPTTDDPMACTPEKYGYCDPAGFEPMDDEFLPMSTPAKAALFLGASALVAVVVAKALS